MGVMLYKEQIGLGYFCCKESKMCGAADVQGANFVVGLLL